MRNKTKFIKEISYLFCLSFFLSVNIGYAADAVMTYVEDVSEEEAFWSNQGKEEARAKATGGNAEAQSIYDAQQNRIEQQKSNQASRDSAVSSIQQNLENQKAQNNQKVTEAQNATKQAQSAYEAAQKQLQSATTTEEMKAANEALKQAKTNLDKAEDAQKDVEKSVNKANKALDKQAKKKTKSADKALKAQQEAIEKKQKAQQKAIEKAQEDAEDDLKDANKKIKKLEERCAKGKCDDEDLKDLSAARAAAAQAQADLDAANQKATAFYAEDDDVANREYLDNLVEEGDRAKAYAESQLSEETLADAMKDIEEAQSAAPKMCSEVEGNIFLLIACKAMITLADLRVIAYIISGFGMIALAYAAIFGKMSFKHLANIGIGLFLLSMMTPFIEYFTTGKDGTLRFGKYLPAGFSDIQGSNGTVEDCVEDYNKNSTFCDRTLMETTVKAQKQKWSLKDLKGSITSGLNAVRNASDMYKTAKSTIETTTNAVSNMKSQIQSGGGGLDGIINAANAVASATGSIVSSGQTLASNIASNTGELSNNLRDTASTNSERNARQKLEENTQKLANKCNAGNCSESEKQELEYLQNRVEENKTGVNKWLENDGTGGGSTLLAGINKVGNITNKTASSIRTTTTAVNEGKDIGGEGTLGAILGVGFGVGTGITEGMNMASEADKKGTFDFRSEETKREEKAQAEQEAFQKTSAYVKTETKKGDTTIQNLGDGSIKTINETTGTITVIANDGTTTITSKDGTTVVKNTDGSKVVTDSKGNKVNYDANGKKTVTLVEEYNRPTAESMQNALTGKKTTETKTTETKTTETKTTETKTEEKPSVATKSSEENSKSTTEKKDTAKTKTEATKKTQEQNKAKAALEAKKKKRLAECEKVKNANLKKDCVTCANIDDYNGYVSCIQAANERSEKAAEEEAQAKTKASREEWCKQRSTKDECFMAQGFPKFKELGCDLCNYNFKPKGS